MAFPPGSKYSQEAMAMFDKNSLYPDLAALVEARFKNMENMLPGSVAPAIKLLSQSGRCECTIPFKPRNQAGIE